MENGSRGVARIFQRGGGKGTQGIHQICHVELRDMFFDTKQIANKCAF